MSLSVDELRDFGSNWGNLVVQKTRYGNGEIVKAGGLRHALGSLFHTAAAQARNHATYISIRDAIMQDERFFAPEVKEKAKELLAGLDNGSRIKASTIKSIIRQLDAMSTPAKQQETIRKATIGHLAASEYFASIPGEIKEKYTELAADFAAYITDPEACMGSIDVGQRVSEFEELMRGNLRKVYSSPACEIYYTTLSKHSFYDDFDCRGPVEKLRALPDMVEANLKELQKIGVTRGIALHHSFVAMLKRTGALSPNVMTAVADKGASLPKCGLELLNRGSEAGAIHKAISKMADAMDKAFAELDPSVKSALDADDLRACLVKAATVRLPLTARRDLLDALESKGGMNLLGFYAQHSADPKAQRMQFVFSSLFTHLRSEFTSKAPDAPVSVPNVDAAALPPELVFDFATGVDDIVTGTAAQQIKDFALSAGGIDDSANPVAELSGRMNAIAKGLVTKSVVMRMENLRAGEFGEKNGPPDLDLRLASDDYLMEGINTFGADYMQIHLADGTVVSPKSPQEARNALVKLITDDPFATYNEYTDPEVKTKVNILLDRMTAESVEDMKTAVGAAFEPEGKRRVINPYGVAVKEKNVFSKDENGAITVSQTIRVARPNFAMINKDSGAPWVYSGDDNSFFEASLSVTFSADNLDGLARADWTQLDSTELLTAIDSGPGDKAPHRYEKIPDSVPEAYRFTGDVSMTFNLHADTIKPDPLQSNQFVDRWKLHMDPV